MGGGVCRCVEMGCVHLSACVDVRWGGAHVGRQGRAPGVNTDLSTCTCRGMMHVRMNAPVHAGG